jgi:hypothetical protein
MHNHNPATLRPNSRPNLDRQSTRDTTRDSEHGMDMTEQNDHLALAREEIAARVASFKATQKKFERERQEYFVTTLENARNGFGGKVYSS